MVTMVRDIRYSVPMATMARDIRYSVTMVTMARGTRYSVSNGHDAAWSVAIAPEKQHGAWRRDPCHTERLDACLTAVRFPTSHRPRMRRATRFKGARWIVSAMQNGAQRRISLSPSLSVPTFNENVAQRQI